MTGSFLEVLYPCKWAPEEASQKERRLWHGMAWHRQARGQRLRCPSPSPLPLPGCVVEAAVSPHRGTFHSYRAGEMRQGPGNGA